ncbi:O-antigen ligase family protein [Flavobacteriaceae bacterium]|nr:O-antigen ligase family protein [Flavobacteriaceae bacterium]
MSTFTLDSNDLPKYLLLILYIITGSLSNLGAIDILAPQWIYLGSINILSCLYFLFISPNALDTAFRPLFKSVFIYIYLFYIVWNALSYFYAINPVETLINLPRLGNTFFAIVFSFFLIYNLPNKFYFISRLLLLFLMAELVAYYNDFANVYPKEGLRVIAIKGFAGNKNITAASIAFKLPFVLYLLHTIKKKFIRFGLVLVLFCGVLAVSLIEARAAILSSIIVLFSFLAFQIYLIISRHLTIKRGLLSIGLTILPYILALFVNVGITLSAKKGAITDTVGRISFTEESSNGRFNYWGDALSYVKKNPLFASGLGNWKIASISEGKEHISGYTVPYHAHNDFIHVFTETGILGGLAYLAIFGTLTFYLILLLYKKYKAQGILELQYFFLLLPLIVYGIDAGLNFPVARPLMQSSFAIFAGLVLGLYLDTKHRNIKFEEINVNKQRFLLSIILLFLIPGLYIHILSFNSLKKQGQLLFEFNNAKFNLTRAQLDEISHDFPNLTETAMPIKAMKARYYYLQGNKNEAFQMIDEGIKDNPQIYFGENLKAQYLLQENKIDSAYVYAKRAFEGLPNNMPHYDIYMRTMVLKKDYQGIDAAFNRVQPIAGDTKTVWLIYIRSLAQTRSLGDSFAMDQAAKAYALFPEDETFFLLYRILTYGQPRIVEAEQIFTKANEAYTARDFNQAAQLFKQAFDLDPLQPTYCLNTGLAFYEAKQFDNAIEYFDLAMALKRNDIVERALRYKGLSLYQGGRGPEACAVFLNLKNNYPKRMYQQEFQKYCLGQN